MEYYKDFCNPVTSLEDLLELLLDKTLHDVTEYLLSKINTRPEEIHQTSSRKRLMSEVVGGSKKIKQDYGKDRNLNDELVSCDDHVAGTIVESWRRGQHFINGR